MLLNGEKKLSFNHENKFSHGKMRTHLHSSRTQLYTEGQKKKKCLNDREKKHSSQHLKLTKKVPQSCPKTRTHFGFRF